MAGGDGKKEPVVTEYKFAQKPDTKEGFEGFRQFVWNSETSEFLGRTGMSWLKIGIFYIIYYTCLAGFFIVMLLIFYQTLSDEYPKWKAGNGIIGENPGVGFRPRPHDDHIESTLIWFRRGDEAGNWKDWVTRFESEIITKYYNDTGKYKDVDGFIKDKVDCGDYGEKQPKQEKYDGKGSGQQCKVNKETLFKDDCKPENYYGFKEGKPCIIIKLNKIYDWEPKIYNHLHPDFQLPKDFPKILKDQYDDNVQTNRTELNEKVWIECHGVNPADVENMGPIEYYPTMGFSKHFYPYKNQKDYLSPVVFMQMKNPKIGVMIAVECMAWAKNIEHHPMDRRGLAHFEVMID